jgi:hypothetical protein
LDVKIEFSVIVFFVKLAVYLEILRGGENNQRERKKIRPFLF